jgi:hypothetical protein
MLTKYDMRIAAESALKLKGIKRFEKHVGKIKWLHGAEEEKEREKQKLEEEGGHHDR